MTSWLIGSGLSGPPVRPNKGQRCVPQVIDLSVVGSMTAQPPGSRPNALRVTTHDQQVAQLVGVPLCRGVVGLFYSPKRQGNLKSGYLSPGYFNNDFSSLLEIISVIVFIWIFFRI